MIDPVGEHITFEVTVPTSSPEAVDKLYAMAEESGLRVTSRRTLLSDLQVHPNPDALKVTDSDLREISRDIWGRATYGTTAANFLNETRRDFAAYGGNVVTAQYHTGALNGTLAERLADFPRRHPLAIGATSASESPFRQQDIEAVVWCAWLATPYPFEAGDIIPKQARTDGVLTSQEWLVEPGLMNRARLAHYARTQRFNERDPQGAIRNALDVINIAAGLVSKEVVAARPQPDLTFINYREFRHSLRDSDLSRAVQEIIRTVIEASLAYQIGSPRYSYTTPASKVIVEGVGGWRTAGGSRHLRFEQIACVSLAQLLDGERFKANKYAAAKRFLESAARGQV